MIIFPREIIFVGVHIRRTDYLEHVKKHYLGHIASTKFYTDAMDIFRQKFRWQKCDFIIVSDDIKWSEKHLSGLPDVYFAKNCPRKKKVDSVGFDFGILVSCNHSIFR